MGTGRGGEGRLETSASLEKADSEQGSNLSDRVLMAVNFVAKQVGLRRGREMSARKNLKQSAKPSKFPRNELKLSSNVERSWTSVAKQLHKKCQGSNAPTIWRKDVRRSTRR